MTTDGNRRWVVTDRVVFDLLLLGLFLVFVIGAFQYNPKARSIPLGVGAIGAVMIALQLLVDAVPRTRARLHFVAQKGLLGRAGGARPGAPPPAATAGGEPGAAAEPEPEPSWLVVFRLILWLFGFVVLFAWTDYLIAVGVFTLLVTALEARTGWVKAFVLAVGVDLAFYLLFQVILGARI